jgi:RNA polymerase sigma factor (sigma-70 family)
MNDEQSEKNLKRRQKYIKGTLKEKIAIYKPLDFTTTYKEFIQLIQDGELKVIKEIPVNCKAEWCLNVLIKNILIPKAYYALGEKYIRQRLMNRLGISDPNDIKLLEIVDYIMERLERNGLEKLKKFKEKCKFKTYLSLLAASLLMDFWRKKYRADKSAAKYKTDFEDLFNPAAADPLEVLIDAEGEARKNQASQVLPQILERLNPEEKIVYQLKYEIDIKKISEIARRLGYNRYKTKQLVNKLERKIKIKLLKGGNHESPGN